MMDELRRTDPEIAHAIAQDTERQRYHVNLVASENYASRAVLEALGTPMSNKYAAREERGDLPGKTNVK